MSSSVLGPELLSWMLVAIGQSCATTSSSDRNTKWPASTTTPSRQPATGSLRPDWDSTANNLTSTPVTPYWPVTVYARRLAASIPDMHSEGPASFDWVMKVAMNMPLQ